MEVKKAVEMVSVLRFKKDDNEMKIEGHLSNEEKMDLIKVLLKAGWKPFEEII